MRLASKRQPDVAPGADVGKIQIAYKGINGLKVADDGSLVILTAFGQWRESPPMIYQNIAGERVSVKSRFKIVGNDAYTFELGSYRNEYAVTIDPTLLFSTYFGGTGQAVAQGIATDPQGNSYLTGNGPLGIFPTTPGVFQVNCLAPSPCSTGFVSKFNPVGALQYSTYLGSTTGGDHLSAIAVDGQGNAYTTGVANAGFPTTPSAFQTTCPASNFAAQLNSSGTGLLYSTCFGSATWGPDGDIGATGIALDSRGRAYVTGSTLDPNFPTTQGALQPVKSGYLNAFLSVIDPSLLGVSSLVYSTFLGGGGDAGLGVAVDAYANAYLTGSTTSTAFPVTPNAFQKNYLQAMCINGGSTPSPTGFVSKVNPNVSGPGGLIYSSYLGGTGVPASPCYGDQGLSIAVDALGSAYIGGLTDSPNFWTTPGAYQPLPFTNGGYTRIRYEGQSLWQRAGILDFFGKDRRRHPGIRHSLGLVRQCLRSWRNRGSRWFFSRHRGCLSTQ